MLVFLYTKAPFSTEAENIKKIGAQNKGDDSTKVQ